MIEDSTKLALVKVIRPPYSYHIVFVHLQMAKPALLNWKEFEKSWNGSWKVSLVNNEILHSKELRTLELFLFVWAFQPFIKSSTDDEFQSYKTRFMIILMKGIAWAKILLEKNWPFFALETSSWPPDQRVAKNAKQWRGHFLLRHLKEWILFLQLVSIPVVLMPKINLLENGNLTVGSLISSALRR